MVDVTTPLDGRPSPLEAQDREGSTLGTLRLSHAPAGSLIQVAGWGAGFNDTITPLLSSFGLNAVSDFQKAQTGTHCVCLRIAPNRLLIWHKNAKATPDTEPKPDPSIASLLNLSHSRISVTVAGTRARDLMERLCTIDLRAQSFPAGSFAQTTIHHTSSVIFHPKADCYELLIPSSYALSLWNYILEAARPLGLSPSKK